MKRSEGDRGDDDGNVEADGVLLEVVVRLCRRHRPCPGLRWYRLAGVGYWPRR